MRTNLYDKVTETARWCIHDSTWIGQKKVWDAREGRLTRNDIEHVTMIDRRRNSALVLMLQCLEEAYGTAVNVPRQKSYPDAFLF